jgi:hypothetical protein
MLILPSNCLVENNPPMHIEKTLGLKPTQTKKILEHDIATQKILLAKLLKEWDEEYWEKTNIYPVFLVCKKIFVELNNPPILLLKDLNKIFGRVPVTRTPPEIKRSEYKKILTFINCQKKK